MSANSLLKKTTVLFHLFVQFLLSYFLNAIVCDGFMKQFSLRRSEYFNIYMPCGIQILPLFTAKVHMCLDNKAVRGCLMMYRVGCCCPSYISLG